MTFNITKITLLTDIYSTDTLYITTDLPLNFPIFPNSPTTFSVSIQAGYGKDWCLKALNRSPDEIIELTTR